MITKRTFLAVSSVGLTAGSAPGLLWAAQQQPPTAFQRAFSRDRFHALANAPFMVSQAAAPRGVLELVDVSDGPVCAGTEQFSVTFRNASGADLPEGLYDFGHADTGRFQLHLVPAGRDERGAYVRASFCLVRA